jgi:hypothetical protein
MCIPSLHLETETDPVSETLRFIFTYDSWWWTEVNKSGGSEGYARSPEMFKL